MNRKDKEVKAIMIDTRVLNYREEKGVRSPLDESDFGTDAPASRGSSG